MDIIFGNFVRYNHKLNSICSKYENFALVRYKVKIGKGLGEWFSAEIGNRQGDPISPLAFISLLGESDGANRM